MRIADDASDRLVRAVVGVQRRLRFARSARRLPQWIMRAATDLPLPTGPSINTVESLAAARLMLPCKRRITGQRPASALPVARPSTMFSSC